MVSVCSKRLVALGTQTNLTYFEYEAVNYSRLKVKAQAAVGPGPGRQAWKSSPASSVSVLHMGVHARSPFPSPHSLRSGFSSLAPHSTVIPQTATLISPPPKHPPPPAPPPPLKNTLHTWRNNCLSPLVSSVPPPDPLLLPSPLRCSLNLFSGSALAENHMLCDIIRAGNKEKESKREGEGKIGLTAPSPHLLSGSSWNTLAGNQGVNSRLQATSMLNIPPHLPSPPTCLGPRQEAVSQEQEVKRLLSGGPVPNTIVATLSLVLRQSRRHRKRKQSPLHRTAQRTDQAA
ncbi:hypothetical protein JZ751_022879, partial [Albula glossodonta]